MKKLNKKGFTLAELLIVVAIIAVLAAIAIPIFTSQLAKSKTATDQANIRSGYATVTAQALTDKVTTGTYYLYSDGTVSTNKPSTDTTTSTAGAYKCKGASDTNGTDVAGQLVTWKEGSTISYSVSETKVTITATN